jgi:hypothetical protein
VATGDPGPNVDPRAGRVTAVQGTRRRLATIPETTPRPTRLNSATPHHASRRAAARISSGSSAGSDQVPTRSSSRIAVCRRRARAAAIAGPMIASRAPATYSPLAQSLTAIAKRYRRFRPASRELAMIAPASVRPVAQARSANAATSWQVRVCPWPGSMASRPRTFHSSLPRSDVCHWSVAFSPMTAPRCSATKVSRPIPRNAAVAQRNFDKTSPSEMDVAVKLGFPRSVQKSNSPSARLRRASKSWSSRRWTIHRPGPTFVNRYVYPEMLVH